VKITLIYYNEKEILFKTVKIEQHINEDIHKLNVLQF
jgi:hypothetical protein